LPAIHRNKGCEAATEFQRVGADTRKECKANCMEVGTWNLKMFGCWRA